MDCTNSTARDLPAGHAYCAGFAACQVTQPPALSELTDAQLVTRLSALADSARATGHTYPEQQLQEALAEAVGRSSLDLAEIARAVRS